MRILVTGAQGCIGSWVVKGLLDRHLEVLLFDLEAEPVRLRWIAPPDAIARATVRTGSIADTGLMKRLVRDEGVTHIVHLAAQLIPFCQANPVEGALTNVVGTLNVFEAARYAGRPVRVVYASSAAVWGPAELYDGRELTEVDPLNPATHYGIFKQANEACARVFYESHGVSSIGLRPWTVYGLGRDEGLTADLTMAIRATVEGKPFRIRMTGYYDFQYVEDVAEALIAAMLDDRAGAHIFNFSGELASIEQFITELSRQEPDAQGLISAEGPQLPVAYRMRDEALTRFLPGIHKTPLRKGIQKTIELYRGILSVPEAATILRR